MKKKALISSILTIALCLSLIAGSTFALFTSESKVNVAVTSGTVDVVAAMKAGSLKAYSGQWNATLGDYESVEVSADNATAKTFANGGTVVANDESNVLTIDKITPMDKVSFVIEVTNNSNVAIQYQTVISSLTVTASNDGVSLLDGLKVTIDSGETTKVGNNAVTDWSSDFAAGEVKEINVEIELPYGAGNEYQGLSAEISYVVNAVQGNAYVENPVADSGITYIYTVADLKEFAADVNSGNSFNRKTVKLMANVDLANEAWTPIGNSTNKFQGTFDGGNFTISNLNVGAAGQSNVGLFGFTTNGTIKNLKVHNATVVGRLNVGVVAGTPYTSKYENITVTGHVTVDGMAYVGGVAGKNAYADWSNITVDVDETSYVKADSVENGTAYRTYVGGVVGFVGEGNHTFSNITSNIDVIGSTIDAGGIVGIAHYGTKYVNCVSTGDVTITNASEAADAEEIGGIAGVWNNGGAAVTFEDCYFTGTLTTNITAGVDLSDNTITGAAYSATGTGELVIIYNGVQLATSVAQLQKLLDAATDGATIQLAKNIDGYVTVTQKPDVKITIDGNGFTFAGSITVDGKSAAYATAGLTIKNIVFKADTITTDACIRLGAGTNATRYTSNVTVSGCTFDVPGAVGVKSYTGGCKNLVITGCTATEGTHSLAQLKGVDGVLVEYCNVKSVRGISFGNSNNVVLDNSYFDVTNYGVRFGADDNTTVETYAVTNCTVICDCNDLDDGAAIVLRKGATNANLTLKGNTLEGPVQMKGHENANIIVD